MVIEAVAVSNENNPLPRPPSASNIREPQRGKPSCCAATCPPILGIARAAGRLIPSTLVDGSQLRPMPRILFTVASSASNAMEDLSPTVHQGATGSGSRRVMCHTRHWAASRVDWPTNLAARRALLRSTRWQKVHFRTDSPCLQVHGAQSPGWAWLQPQRERRARERAVRVGSARSALTCLISSG